MNSPWFPVMLTVGVGVFLVVLSFGIEFMQNSKNEGPTPVPVKSKK